jgi:hypothetical protein
VYALGAEDGRFQLIVDATAPMTQYWATLVTSGNILSSTNIRFAKGSNYFGTPTITGGSLTPRPSRTAPVSSTPAPGCSVAVCGGPQSGTLTVNPAYNKGGALSRNTVCVRYINAAQLTISSTEYSTLSVALLRVRFLFT